MTSVAPSAAAHEARVWSPCPIVGWESVLTAMTPGQAPTRGRARLLKQKHLLTQGVRVPRRGAQHLEGARTYHSVLTSWAARCRQEGLREDAEALESAAERVEARFAQHLRNFLVHHDLSDLPKADFFSELVGETSRALTEVTSWRTMLVAVATVSNVGEALSRLDGVTPDGDSRTVDLPTRLLDEQHIGPGSHVFVFSRMLGTAALVEIEAAVSVDAPRESALPRVSDESVDDDGYTSAEGAEMAARYAREAGARPSADEVAAVLRDVERGAAPRRRLRPAG